MNSNEKYYIRKIVLSYLEACRINREPQKKIQEDIAKKRMTILNAIMKNGPKDEVQAVYAILNFVSQLEHPSNKKFEISIRSISIVFFFSFKSIYFLEPKQKSTYKYI